MSDRDRLVGSIIKSARLIAGFGLREFGERAKIPPSRFVRIQLGDTISTIELALIADEFERILKEKMTKMQESLK